eukprot:GEZU01025717.1.p1 GENE.GEZU01025717.1~~GEZU01025717.1.p1  ORF type:complete len:152 (-),score=35.19 GEZU01025717.1:96-551(-)
MILTSTSISISKATTAVYLRSQSILFRLTLISFILQAVLEMVNYFIYQNTRKFKFLLHDRLCTRILTYTHTSTPHAALDKSVLALVVAFTSIFLMTLGKDIRIYGQKRPKNEKHAPGTTTPTLVGTADKELLGSTTPTDIGSAQERKVKTG